MMTREWFEVPYSKRGHWDRKSAEMRNFPSHLCKIQLKGTHYVRLEPSAESPNEKRHRYRAGECAGSLVTWDGATQGRLCVKVCIPRVRHLGEPSDGREMAV